MEVNLVVEGFKFMVLGMTIVFLFLLLMIGAMIAMSRILHRYFPEPKATETRASAGADKKRAAAIAAAIHHHNS